MLVSAFVTSPNTNQQFINFKSSIVGKTYLTAIKEKYRFYSFGDAMFIR
jgi:S-adenosylmethionine:tRNA-ribosyltransferase-isomerase (queuine synthetase)